MTRITIPPQVVARYGAQGIYRAHQLLWKFYGDEPTRQRDFLFRMESTDEALVFLVVSQRRPINSLAEVTIETKSYNPQVRTGERYEFIITVNPVIRSKENGKRHDVVMHARRLCGGGKRDIRTPVVAWLQARAANMGCAFLEESLAVSAYQQARFVKKGMAASISTCEISGVLTVQDEAAFLGALTTGIGSAKGLGCGLLLLRPLRVPHASAA